jgi:hypothetical protein
VVLISSFALVGVVALVVIRLWVPAIILGTLWAGAALAATILLRRADPHELKAREARNYKWLDAWARGMGKVSGGWEPRRSSRTDDSV